MNKDFEEYLKNARERFCLVFRDYNAKEVDSFLIAYDQAVQKAITVTRCCKSDSELLAFLDNLEKLPRVKIPYDMKMLAIHNHLKS